MSKALVIFSGGIDSTFCLFHAKNCFDEVKTLTFDYGQRHHIETNSAAMITGFLSVENTWITMPILNHKNSPLLNLALPIDVFENYAEAEQKLKGKVEPAFIPMRNSIFLDIAVNRAIVDDCYDIYIGVSKEDGDTVPDCTVDFLRRYEQAANAALGLSWLDETHLRLHAPLLTLGKVNGILEAFDYPGCYAAFAFSHTSYFGEYPPRARDHASVCREWAFEKAGVPDPLIIRAFLEKKMPLPDNNLYKEWEKYIPFGAFPPITWKLMLEFEKAIKIGLGR